MHIQYIWHFEVGFCPLDSFAMQLRLALKSQSPCPHLPGTGIIVWHCFSLRNASGRVWVNTSLRTHQMEHGFQDEQQTERLRSWGVRVPLLSGRIKLQRFGELRRPSLPTSSVSESIGKTIWRETAQTTTGCEDPGQTRRKRWLSFPLSYYLN